MKQSEMLAALKELRSELLRYAAGNDSIVPGAYAEALDEVIKTLGRITWRKVEDELPEIGEYAITYNPIHHQPFLIDRINDIGGWVIRYGSPYWIPMPEMPKGENDE